MKTFYSSNSNEHPHNYRTNEQFKSFISNTPSTFDINEFHDYHSRIDSRYYEALDNQEAYIYDSRYIVDSQNVIFEDLHKNKSHLRRSSSQESMNTFNPYTINAYPEFLQIGGQTAYGMLKKYLSQEISTYEFQHYILECLDDLMENQPLEYKTNNINIFERCCDDSVICFSNVVHKIDNKRLSKEELKSLFNDMRDIDDEYHLPCYDGRYEFIEIMTDDINELVKNVVDVIAFDVDNKVENRFIGLNAPFDVIKQRIYKRGRNGEENYKINQLKLYSRHYDLLYDKLKRHEIINKFEQLAELV